MKHRLLFLTISAAVLGLSVGCIFPERGQRRGSRPEQRRDDDRRGRDHDRDHDERHGPAAQPGLTQ